MKINRGLAGLATLTAATLTLTGCGSDDESTPATPRAAATAASPAEQLVDSVPDKTVPAYGFEASGACAVPISGVLDAPGNTIRTTITQKIPEAGGSVTMTFLAIGTDKPYVKIALKPASLARRMGVPKGWTAVDPAKISDFGSSPLSYDGETDPLATASLFEAASGVTGAGGKFTGKLDLTKVTGADALVDEKTVTALGAKATSVPFEAVVDATSGGLAAVKVKLPKAGKVKGGTCTLAYQGYGDTPAPAAPAKARKTPATVYDMLNS